MKRTTILFLGLLLAMSVVAGAAGTVPGTSLKYEKQFGARTTGYVTGTCNVDTNGDPRWCSPTAGECITSLDQMRDSFSYIDGSCISQGKGWCCIREEDRGFYEEVKCQGSGVCQEQTYNTETITTEPGEEPIQQDYERGITVTGDEPTPQDTIAVNVQEGSACYIPLGSRVYLDFGSGHEWNGEYTAEDVGSAMQGDGRAPNGNCKIDVYTGVDDEAGQAEQVTRQDATAYIISTPDNKSVTTATPSSSSPDNTVQQGFIESTYQYNNDLPVLNSFESFLTTIKDDLDSCAPASNPRKCAQDVLQQAETQKWQAQPTCQPIRQRPVSDDADTTIISQGIVQDPGSITTTSGDSSQPNSRTITLNESDGSTVITLLSESIDKLSVEQGENIQVLSSQPQTRSPYIEVNLDISGEIRTLRTQTDRIISYLTELASCRTAEDMCVCEIDNQLENPITLANGTATTTDVIDEAQPYFFQLHDGSNIPTSITSSIIQQNTLDFSLLQTQLAQSENAESTVLPGEETSYFLKATMSNSLTDVIPGVGDFDLTSGTPRLAKLDENPAWYQGQKNDEAYNDNLNTALTNALDITQTITNPASHIAGDQNSVPTCEPQTTYQSVCIQKKQGATMNPPMSIPPFQFIQPI